MNSLEFIKQHVTEWPSDKYHTVFLYGNGFAVFANSIEPGMGVHSIDLTEHFAPSYYDGKVWTREEFEACGKSTVYWNNAPGWDEAPSWATSYGFAGLSKFPVWYNNNGYMNVDDPSQLYEFSRNTNFTINDITHHSHRPTPNTESQQDNLDDGKKYEATIIGLCGTVVKIDIYRVLDAYPQVDPHIEHLIKKALKPGERGHKDKRTDYLNIIESAQKALKLLDQKERLNDE